MSEPVRHEVTYPELVHGTPGRSGLVNEYQLRLVNVDVLEFEDVLFHYNSAVMMPEHPQGASSQDSGGPSDEQDRITGIRALALAFRQCEFDPRKRMIISGHTDTSGGIEYNFGLSELRAANVHYLLRGDMDSWIDTCAERHKVEDYQQIIKYFHFLQAPWKRSNWNCDPGDIDDNFRDNTKTAINNFAAGYNRDYASLRSLETLPENLGDIIKRDSKHRWPHEYWHALYHLYNQVLCDTLQVAPEELDKQREQRLRYVSDEKPFVGCGESFPIDQQYKDNYRSQKNRRVEILFFNENETLEINCPVDVTRKHTERECPLAKSYYLKPHYIDPGDLYAVAYHLKFQFFDRVKKDTAFIPEGLQIRSFIENETEPYPSRQVFADNVYTVIVQFRTQDEANNKADKVRFEFEAANRYVKTDSTSAQPVMEEKTTEEINTIRKDPVEGWKYYDLPVRWSSQNWRCMVGDEVKDFSEHVKNRTRSSTPIIFNLDDIVLLDSDGKQTVTDRNGEATGAHPHGRPQPLSNRSRVRILYVDPNDQQMKIYGTKTSGTVREIHESSLIRFEKNHSNQYMNFLKNPPGGTRAVVFCGEFYDVTYKRTVADANFRPADGHILGARAAVVDDADVHVHELFRYNNATRTVHAPRIGDFDIHYLHGGGLDSDNKPYSYVVVYWSSYITKDTKPTTSPTNARNTPATDAEVKEFENIGMVNSMNHWNQKQYQFEDTAGSNNRIIRPFFMFEAFEEFNLSLSTPIDFYDDAEALFAHADFRRALREARGGVPHSITFIVEERKGSWVLSYRSSTYLFSTLSLRIKTRRDDPARFAGFPFTEWGKTYGCLVMAHELGHATGQKDDYNQDMQYRETVSGHTHTRRVNVPSFGQFGYTSGGDRITINNSNFSNRVEGSEAYEIHHDGLTLMVKNGPIRMRHVWRFTHWINEGSKPGGVLNGFLGETRYQIKYPTANMTYYRTTAQKVDPWMWSHSATLTVTTNRTMNVYLFQGLDETRLKRRTAGNLEFKAILAVRPLLSVAFVNNGSHTWSRRRKADWLEAFYELFDEPQLAGKYMLTGGGGDLDPTIIRFIPGLDVYNAGGSPAHSEYNFRIEVKRNSTDAITQSGNIIRLGEGVDERRLLNYLFGKSQTDTTFATGDFDFIKNWFSGSSVGNGTFRIEEV